jgi:hypothetical protein
VVFEARPGQRLEFEVANALTGWRMALVLLYVILWRDEYLLVRAAG